jgi:hypothetical protein
MDRLKDIELDGVNDHTQDRVSMIWAHPMYYPKG